MLSGPPAGQGAGDVTRTRDRSKSTEGGLGLSGSTSGQGAGGRARTRDRGVFADVRAVTIFTVPPTALKNRVAKTEMNPFSQFPTCMTWAQNDRITINT
ncbi:hypothetical protein PoB_000152900 [Plakobranchus ocellatus]|uniref:Uncharacterized protein n=1 Tax=Plakobranchus ocellatus TaxID=259542 RepID=A0AAV3XZ61_9GAST|nr:hypothetical protein PoB_000152900 [Plakobranchus ocellatus]